MSGEEIWCQLFSEPGAGSDLANLSTRAIRDGDDYVVNGQKVWTSIAHFSKFGILIARTDPTRRSTSAISYFICPMDLPGIEIRPIVDMTSAHAFNEVFFDDVRIPAANLVGEEGRGWELGKVTLGNERVSLSGEGALWGRGPTANDLVELVRTNGGLADPRAAPATRRDVHRGRAARDRPDAHAAGEAPRRAARPGSVGAQGARGRARPARDGAREGHRRHGRAPAETARRSATMRWVGRAACSMRAR